MKYIITESQYKKLLIENEKLDNYISLFIDEVKYESSFNDILEKLNTFGINLEMIKNSRILNEFLLNRLLSTQNFRIPTSESDKEITLFFLRKIYNLPNDISKRMLFLNNLYFNEDGWVRRQFISFLIDENTEPYLEYLKNTFDPRTIIEKLSIIRQHFKGETRTHVDNFVEKLGEENNLIIFNKYNKLTFNKKENSLIDKLIAFIKDTPEIPNKTKTNFLKYIGSHYTRGQYSTFFSAVVHSKIIERVGGGSNVTYKLGPNYQAWVENRLVAY